MIFDLDISNSFFNYIILFLDVLFGIIVAFFINNFIESISFKKKLRSILLDFNKKMQDDINLLNQYLVDLKEKEKIINNILNADDGLLNLNKSDITILRNFLFKSNEFCVRKSQFHSFGNMFSEYDIKDYRLFLKLLSVYDFHINHINHIHFRINHLIDNNIKKYNGDIFLSGLYHEKTFKIQSIIDYLDASNKAANKSVMQDIEVASALILNQYKKSIKAFLIDLQKYTIA